MNLSNLFTPTGFAEALKAYHKHLHQNYNFPPLNGAKPLHRFAELFDLKNAEQLTNRLENIGSNTFVQSGTSVNLVRDGHNEFVVCYFEPEDNTLRVQRQDQSPFIITTMENGMSSAPEVHYLDNHIALITFKYEQIIITLEDDGIIAKQLESSDKSHCMNPFNDNSKEKGVELIDEQADFLSDPIDDNQKKNTLESVYIVVRKQLDNVYTHAEVSYQAALDSLKGELIDDAETLSTPNEILDELHINHDSQDDHDLANSEINKLDENELNNLYQFLHGNESSVQINQSRL